MKFINAQRIRQLGRVKRMEVGATPRKMMEERLFIERRKGRPRLRWMDGDVADLKVMKIKQWMEKTKDREQWRLVVEEAKVHPGLQCRENGWMEYLNKSNMEIVLNFAVQYRVIHKSVKHFKNSQQIDYATDHGNSYVDRERNCFSFF